jgi:hypothetical protein
MSLLAELCFKFQTHPENLATEALGVLLNERLLGDAFSQLIAAQLNEQTPSGLIFRTQDSGDDRSRPDIVALRPDGGVRAIIEAKFWAALTDNQPISYLARLEGTGPGWLVFVAPAARHELLWAELLTRLTTGGVRPVDLRAVGSEIRIAAIGPSRMILVSWRILLTALEDAATVLGSSRKGDIAQLRDLANRVDTDEFLPLRQEELSPQIGRRFYQFTEVLNDVLAKAVNEGIVSRQSKVTGAKSKISGGAGSYGTSVLLGNHWFFLQVSAWCWGLYGATPFWLVFPENTTSGWPELMDALGPLLAESPPRLIIDRRYRNLPIIPLVPPTGAEKENVVAALVAQLREIAALVPASPDGAPPVPAPPIAGQ